MAPSSPPPPPSPPAQIAEAAHNYDEREGDKYLYASAVSEEEKKKGQAVGGVVMFRYLGRRNSVHRLEQISQDGRRLGISECSNPCTIIREDVDRMLKRVPYDVGSIIGAAFEDAINGRLEVARARFDGSEAAAEHAATKAIPVAFRGEWNEDYSACGTGLNDTRLIIEPRRLNFHESAGDVRRVTMHGGSAITVEAAFSGEGETWTNRMTFALSTSGNDLESGGLTRHRCP